MPERERLSLRFPWNIQVGRMVRSSEFGEVLEIQICRYQTIAQRPSVFSGQRIPLEGLL